jgi:hypothetical protein
MAVERIEREAGEADKAAKYAGISPFSSTAVVAWVSLFQSSEMLSALSSLLLNLPSTRFYFPPPSISAVSSHELAAPALLRPAMGESQSHHRSRVL